MKKDIREILLQIISYIIISTFAICCLLPFVLVISGSLSSEKEIIKNGFSLLPKGFTLNAYITIFRNPQSIIDAYSVTIFITLFGTFVGLFLMSMAAFVLNRKDFKYRNTIAFIFYFTTLFSGGLVPFYILMVKYLHLKDSVFAMILPSLGNAWSIFLLRNFMKTIPDSLVESARIDGAHDFYIYRAIILPLAIPVLATIGLFQALVYWNEWYNAMLYIQTESKYPLQYVLQRMVRATDVAELIARGVDVDISDYPSESIKMATTLVVTGPIIFVYPFLQKYFVKGLTIGAIKG
jgi:putative aldouronate transport system permease protein